MTILTPACVWADAPYPERSARIFDLQVELAIAASLFEHYLPLLPQGAGMGTKIAQWREMLAAKPEHSANALKGDQP